MLRLTPRYRLQVPNGLAIIGALLLLAGTVTGLGNTWNAQPGESVAATTRVTSGDLDATESSPEALDTAPKAPVSQKKRFKVNLFLFRR